MMKEQKALIKLIVIALINCFILINVHAQNAGLNKNLHIKSIPYVLSVFNSPIDIEIRNDSVVKMIAPGKTNLFNSPGGDYYKQDAPMLLFHPDRNFLFSVKVDADLKEVYDVAALVLYQNNDVWAKLCFENSVNKEATVVSVVTKRYSDDCNSTKISQKYIYLAVSKRGNEFSFHYSTDNKNWNLVRHFRIDFDEHELMVGFAVHGSRGKRFSAEFSNIKYSDKALGNMRTYR